MPKNKHTDEQKERTTRAVLGVLSATDWKTTRDVALNARVSPATAARRLADLLEAGVVAIGGGRVKKWRVVRKAAAAALAANYKPRKTRTHGLTDLVLAGLRSRRGALSSDEIGRITGGSRSGINAALRQLEEVGDVMRVKTKRPYTWRATVSPKEAAYAAADEERVEKTLDGQDLRGEVERLTRRVQILTSTLEHLTKPRAEARPVADHPPLVNTVPRVIDLRIVLMPDGSVTLADPSGRVVREGRW